MNEQIGRNLVRLRGDMSQKDLAAQMREHGHKWSQTTVWSVEKGERPLRMDEARALIQILRRLSVDELFQSDRRATVTAAAHAVKRRHDELERAMVAFARARVDLAIAMEGLPEGDRDGQVHKFGQSWLDRSILDEVTSFVAETGEGGSLEWWGSQRGETADAAE